jgi:protein-disulfide isomerase
MKRFYVLLGVIGVVGAAALWYAAAGSPSVSAGLAPGAAPPPPAADGFTGFTLGSDSAPVEVVEYSDFECPYCAQFAAVQMPTVQEQLIETGKVRWRYRDFPLPSHAYARLASHAAHCAGEQERFWEMHDQLFFNHSWAQTGRDPNKLFRGFAERIGVDLNRYDDCMASGRHAGRIEASRLEGTQRQVSGTPTLFVNGRLYSGPRSSDALKALVDSMTAVRR